MNSGLCLQDVCRISKISTVTREGYEKTDGSILSVFHFDRLHRGIEHDRAERSCGPFRAEHACGARRTADLPQARQLPLCSTKRQKERSNGSRFSFCRAKYRRIEAKRFVKKVPERSFGVKGSTFALYFQVKQKENDSKVVPFRR